MEGDRIALADAPNRPMFTIGEGTQLRSPAWPFSWYALWRLVGAVVVVFLVLTALFVALEVIPGDPTRTVVPRGCAGPAPTIVPACGPARTLIAQWGLDKPLWDRYLIFLGNMFTGNLGLSLTINPGVPVWTVIAPLVLPTVALLGITLFLTALVALALGLPLRRRRGSLLDGVVSFLLAIPLALTGPVLALLTVYLLVFVFPIISISSGAGLDPAPYAIVVLLAMAAVVGLFTWGVRDHPLQPPSPPHLAAGAWRSTAGGTRAWLRVSIAKFLSAMPALTGWTLATILLSEVVWNVNGLGMLWWRAVVNLDAFVLLGVLVVSGLLIVLPILIATDLLHEWLTRRWVRADGRSVDEFRVRPRDLSRGLRTTLTRATGLVGVGLILVVVGLAALGPFLVGPYPTGLNLARPDLPPSGQHPLGTDHIGRDVLTLVVYGAAPSIPAAIAALAITLIAGLGATAATGFLGPRANVFITALVDAGLVLPLPGLALSVYGWPGSWGIFLPGVLVWPITTRILLDEARGIVPARTGPGGLGGRARGRRALHLIWGSGPLIVGNAFLAVSLALCVSEILDFLGLGSLGPTAITSWGQILTQSYLSLEVVRGAWWTFVPAALCLALTVLGPLLVALAVKRLPLGGDRNDGVPTPPSPVAEVPEAAPVH